MSVVPRPRGWGTQDGSDGLVGCVRGTGAARANSVARQARALTIINIGWYRDVRLQSVLRSASGCQQQISYIGLYPYLLILAGCLIKNNSRKNSACSLTILSCTLSWCWLLNIKAKPHSLIYSTSHFVVEHCLDRLLRRSTRIETTVTICMFQNLSGCRLSCYRQLITL